VLLEGMHAAQHMLLAAIKLFVAHDPGDVDTEHAYPYQERIRPNHLVIYDTRPGGTGVCEAAFREGSWRLVEAALEMLSHCRCPLGCPSCVHSPCCSEHNLVINKRAAKIILAGILRGVAPDKL